MGMKCFFCKHQLNLFEERCPNCGKAFDDPMTKEEALAVLKKNGVVLNQEPVVEVDNPAAMTILNCYWLENS